MVTSIPGDLIRMINHDQNVDYRLIKILKKIVFILISLESAPTEESRKLALIGAGIELKNLISFLISISFIISLSQ